MKNYFSYWENLLRRIMRIFHDMKRLFMGSFVFKRLWAWRQGSAASRTLGTRTKKRERKNNISL